jgi:serine/threonine-protein kinase HipA
MSKQRVIDVVADWVELGRPTLMGRLTATPARGKEIFAFEYDKDWLTRSPRQALDPAMALYGGPQYPAKSRETFGVFLEPGARERRSGRRR